MNTTIYSKFYIEFLNADGKDREIVIHAADRAEAQEMFNKEYPNCEMLDLYTVVEEA